MNESDIAHMRTPKFVVATALAIILFEFLWFSSKCFRGIDYDGMAYTGIARHLRQGEFYAAINAFRSPLLSWIIAAVPGNNLVFVGKIINISAFLLCSALLYLLTCKLWKSNLAASIALLLFVLGRGLLPSAMSSVVPDFLFATLTLLYYILLLDCFREESLWNWFFLGAILGLAYLAKAFALPWLALSALAAVFLSTGAVKLRFRRLTSAALIPIVVVAAWAVVLHSKYGVYTIGSQFKTNLLQWTLAAYREHPDPTYSVLRDTTKEVDKYVVDDPMPPGSWPWTYRLRFGKTLSGILLAEKRNLPQVLKEILIVVTPGGLLAFIAAAAIVSRRRHQYPVEWRLVMIVMLSAVSLVLAYSMLVFDSRYLYPLIPLLLAVAARFLIPDADWGHNHWRVIAVALVVLGEITTLAYSSSPFRVLNRDFQDSCYDAGNQLKGHDGSSVASIGAGPFPEHGVGWEAPYKAAFFGDRKLIAAMDELPRSDITRTALDDLAKASPDAIMVWGNRKDPRYLSFMQFLSLQYPGAVRAEISDPVLGSVGTILFVKTAKNPGPPPRHK